MGIRCIFATTVNDALEYYRNNYQQIDLVILDIIMPGMSGEETFIGLQAINPDIKVILASGYSLEGQAEKILHMGCKGFIQKPFTHSLLSRKIQEVLQIGTDPIECRRAGVSEEEG